jgi:hypothetical protein
LLNCCPLKRKNFTLVDGLNASYLPSRGEFVIARNVAISVVRGRQTDKREIASQARNDRMCHREERGDLAFPQPANRKERLPRCARNDKMGEIASQARFYVSSRGTKRSHLSTASKQKREIAALRSQ